MPASHHDLPGLAEDVHFVRASADGLERGHGIGSAADLERGEGEWRDDSGRQVKGECRGNRRRESVSRGRTQLVEQNDTGIGLKHG
mgnify:CR=1 FL=1